MADIQITNGGETLGESDLHAEESVKCAGSNCSNLIQNRFESKQENKNVKKEVCKSYHVHDGVGSEVENTCTGGKHETACNTNSRAAENVNVKWNKVWNATLVPELVGIAAEIAIQIYGYVSTRRVLYLVLTVAAIPEFLIPLMFKSKLKGHRWTPVASKALLVVALIAPIWVVVWLEEECRSSPLAVKILLIVDIVYMTALTGFKAICAIKLKGNNRVTADLTCSVTCMMSLITALVVTYKCDKEINNAMSAIAITLPLAVTLVRFVELTNGCC